MFGPQQFFGGQQARPQQYGYVGGQAYYPTQTNGFDMSMMMNMIMMIMMMAIVMSMLKPIMAATK